MGLKKRRERRERDPEQFGDRSMEDKVDTMRFQAVVKYQILRDALGGMSVLFIGVSLLLAFKSSAMLTVLLHLFGAVTCLVTAAYARTRETTSTITMISGACAAVTTVVWLVARTGPMPEKGTWPLGTLYFVLCVVTRFLLGRMESAWLRSLQSVKQRRE